MVVRKPTGEQHNCASFGTLSLSHDGERIENVVGQGDRYAFLLLPVAWVRTVRHIWGSLVLLAPPLPVPSAHQCSLELIPPYLQFAFACIAGVKERAVV